MAACYQCQKELTFNEIGAHKKFINRGSTQYLCKECLARRLDVPVSLIEDKIRLFRLQGCTLFV